MIGEEDTQIDIMVNHRKEISMWATTEKKYNVQDLQNTANSTTEHSVDCVPIALAADMYQPVPLRDKQYQM